jgi:hypothetical protein
MLLDEDVVASLPTRHRLRRGEHVGDADVVQVPALLVELDVGVGERPEELAPPGPGPSGERRLRLDDDDIDLADLEVVPDDPLPAAGGTGKCGGTRLAGSNAAAQDARILMR